MLFLLPGTLILPLHPHSSPNFFPSFRSRLLSSFLNHQFQADPPTVPSINICLFPSQQFTHSGITCLCFSPSFAPDCTQPKDRGSVLLWLLMHGTMFDKGVDGSQSHLTRITSYHLVSQSPSKTEAQLGTVVWPQSHDQSLFEINKTSTHTLPPSPPSLGLGGPGEAWVGFTGERRWDICLLLATKSERQVLSSPLSALSSLPPSPSPSYR